MYNSISKSEEIVQSAFLPIDATKSNTIDLLHRQTLTLAYCMYSNVYNYDCI